MTINEVREIDDYTPEIIRAQVAEYSGGRVKLSDEVVSAMIIFLRLSVDHREAFLENLSALVCDKCGKPSCLCGYSDE